MSCPADRSEKPDDPSTAQNEAAFKDERFPKSERLTRRPQFLQTRRNGRRAEGRWVVVYVAPNAVEHPRLGVTVSKRVGNAVVRNRWKRRLREIFRRHKQDFGSSHDIVIIVKRGAEEPDFLALLADLQKTIQRALKSGRQRR